MPRKANPKKWRKPPLVDVRVPGLNAEGPEPERFRASSEVMTKAGAEAMRSMVKDLAVRGELELLRARLDRRITTTQLYQAYRGVGGTLDDLRQSLQAQSELLQPWVDEWAPSLTTRDRAKPITQVGRFVTWASISRPATTADLCPERVQEFLSGLTSLRSRTGETADAQTKNRYRAAISGLCTYLVKRRVIDHHPIKDGGVGVALDGAYEGRMPEVTRDEYSTYFRSIASERADLPLPHALALRQQLTVFFRILWHTGADLSELRLLKVRDIRWGERMTQVRLKRTKTRTPERLVPYPDTYAAELRAFVEGKPRDALVFDLACVASKSGVAIPAARTAHENARKAIGQPELRIKDLRHLAAIAWARAGVKLLQISQWLGHSTIAQTTVYAKYIAGDDELSPLVAAAGAIYGADSEGS